MNKLLIKEYYNQVASKREKWKKRNRFYHKNLEKYYSFIIPAQNRVIEIGCGTGDLLNSINPLHGVGIDFASNVIEIAKQKYPHLNFYVDNAEELAINEKFDYIIVSDLISCLWDVQKAVQNIKKLCHEKTRIVISNYNYLWESILKLGEKIGLKQKQPNQNWLSFHDIENLLYLEDFQVIKLDRKLLLPKYIPGLHFLFNIILANLPLVNRLDLVNIIIAKPIFPKTTDYTVSIIIPAKNEKGNIENVIKRTPIFGKSQEFIFIEGNSSDNTYEEMIRTKEVYKDKDIKIFIQIGKGKGNAVRQGFDNASGEILMILDADLTTPPEELPKFYEAIRNGKGEFINGCRLVYPMEKQAMRFLNLIGNKFFGWFFSYLLGQKLKDTLCGIKVFFKFDYEKIKKNRIYFGDFDPFGDFDLLFGAAKLNLKIIEIIVRYKEREYGTTQINRFKHGWLLIKMSLFAAKKIKFR